MRKTTLYFKHPKDTQLTMTPTATRVIEAIRETIHSRVPAIEDEARFMNALFLIAASGLYEEQKSKSMQELVDENIYADTFDIAEDDDELNNAVGICDRVLVRGFGVTSEDERTNVVFGIFYLSTMLNILRDQQVLQMVLKEIEEAPEGKGKLKDELLMNPANPKSKQRKIYVKEVKFYRMRTEQAEMPSGEKYDTGSPIEHAEDMLRYDGAYVNEKFPDTVMYLVKRGLMSKPTLERWESFGITLVPVPPPIKISEIDQSQWYTVIQEFDRVITKTRVSMAEEQQRRGYVYMFPIAQ